jgi:hypothetical protein
MAGICGRKKTTQFVNHEAEKERDREKERERKRERERGVIESQNLFQGCAFNDLRTSHKAPPSKDQRAPLIEPLRHLTHGLG